MSALHCSIVLFFVQWEKNAEFTNMYASSNPVTVVAVKTDPFIYHPGYHENWASSNKDTIS